MAASVTRLPTSEIGGVYIGGGNTVRLLAEIRGPAFASYLQGAAAAVPIYGGSAGAIILGEDIRTTPEADSCEDNDARGLALLSGWSVTCHYSGSRDELLAQSMRVGTPLVGLTESTGVIVEHGRLRCVSGIATMAAHSQLTKLGPDTQSDYDLPSRCLLGQ